MKERESTGGERRAPKAQRFCEAESGAKLLQSPHKMYKLQLLGLWHRLPNYMYLGPGGGALPKNMWRVRAATLTAIFKPPVTEWPPFYDSQFALT